MDNSSQFMPEAESEPLEKRLLAFPFVRQLGADGRRLLCSEASSIHLDRRQSILGSGDECSALLLVERGSVRVFKRAENGREIQLYRVGAGESCVLGTTCMLQGDVYPAEAEAEAGTDALLLSATAFRTLHEQEPAVRRFVMDLYARRLLELMVLVDEVAFRKMDERLVALLLRESRVGRDGWKPVEKSHEALASELGTAREVVSRTLNQLADEGLVELERKRVRLIDPAALMDKYGNRASV